MDGLGWIDALALRQTRNGVIGDRGSNALPPQLLHDAVPGRPCANDLRAGELTGKADVVEQLLLAKPLDDFIDFIGTTALLQELQPQFRYRARAKLQEPKRLVVNRPGSDSPVVMGVSGSHAS